MGPPVQPVLAMDLPGVDPSLLALVSEQAAAIGIGRVALVGGAVRDGLLHNRNCDSWRVCRDLDFVVEGDAVALAEALLLRVGSERMPRLQTHPAYGTAELEIDGLLLDLASARRESYPSPGANPLVTLGDLESDLDRRDFSVNAMAMVLGEASMEAGLIDFHKGSQDLELRELVFLHPGSVADDPTRVVRAARYAARLGFTLGLDGLAQVARGVQEWPWTWRTGDPANAAPPALSTRFRMELELLFENEPWSHALQFLEDWGAFPLIDPKCCKTIPDACCACAGQHVLACLCCRLFYSVPAHLLRLRSGFNCPCSRSVGLSRFRRFSFGWDLMRCRLQNCPGRQWIGLSRLSVRVGVRRRLLWRWRDLSGTGDRCSDGGDVGVI